jgi:hypothetical protein
MAESFTYTIARALSEVESSAAMAAAEPSSVAQTRQVIADFIFMIFPYR